MQQLTISVAMCSYNGEKYLQEQLDSIAKQSRPPDEVIVCDDKSTDQSVSILERFSASVTFPVKIFRNDDNLGSTRNFEKAISLCGGGVIALADQDDVWKPNKLETIGNSFSRSPHIGLFFSDANVTDERMSATLYRLWECVGFDIWTRIKLLNGNAFDVMLHHNVVTGATMAFRSDLRKYILPIPTRWVHDGWIAIVASAISEVRPFSERLIDYRQHPNQQIGTEKKGLIREYLDSQSTTAEGYVTLANQYCDVHDRLGLFREEFELDTKLIKVKDKIRHLHARADITGEVGKLYRIALSELISLRYFLYSRGIYSFIKDCRSILRVRGR